MTSPKLPNFRLTYIRDKLFYKLEEKTGWGRNELKELINETLLEVADNELEAHDEEEWGDVPF